MISESEKEDFGSLSEEEYHLARLLVQSNKMTAEQLDQFIEMRNRFDTEGKKYLGDVLIDRGLVSEEIVEEFFAEHNKLYLEFCGQLHEGGFLTSEQHEQIVNDEQSSANVVSAITKLRIMTKESFIRQFENNVQTLKLGEWLVAKDALSPDDLDDALTEQNINTLEDFLLYCQILDKNEIDQFKQKLGFQ